MITIPQQTVLFPELFSKPICISFSKEHLSSDGGAILLKAIDQKLGLTQAIAETIIDHRQPAKVRHEILELTRQRIFSLASGYPDCNDAGRLKEKIRVRPLLYTKKLGIHLPHLLRQSL